MPKSFNLKDIELMDYAKNIIIYKVPPPGAEAALALARLIAAQQLCTFPSYRIVRTASRPVGSIDKHVFPTPDSGRPYAVVGMIDTGTDPTNASLQAYVIKRVEWVPATQQNNEHGTFVAGMLIHPRKLNHNDSRFPGDPCKIVDIVALDKEGTISEDDLLSVLKQSIHDFPEVKVWNLSLTVNDEICDDSQFSALGAALDQLGKDHGITFVIAAGNYTTMPLRAWAPSSLLASDRISPPADAVHAITVGSVAHIDTASTCVRTGDPSPFSRRGPGPGFTPKPEIAHFGGNCDVAGQFAQAGVMSVGPGSTVVENIGTSFATPLISNLTANMQLELSANRSVSPNLRKGLLLHASFLKNGPMGSDRLNYCGVGTPPDVDGILQCSQTSATLMFEIPLLEGPFLYRKDPFPIPTCMTVGGKGFCGEIFMTLLYDPPLDRNFGAEYCRVNVDASLGTLHPADPDSKKHRNKKVKPLADYRPQVAPVAREVTDGFEKEQVRNGYKWSPFKMYYRKASGIDGGLGWRLTLDVLTRAEYKDRVTAHNAVLLITLRDPSPGSSATIYEELLRMMNQYSWQTEDLKLRSRGRFRT